MRHTNDIIIGDKYMTTEFNSNLNLGAIQKQHAVKSTEVKDEIAAAPIEEIEEPKSQGVPVGQSAIAGKSQIKADNVSNDIATFAANPNVVMLSDNFFDKAYDSLVAENDPNAYEKACLMTSEFVNECVKK